MEIVGADKACSGCLIPLISSLILLQKRGVKMNKTLRICLGKDPQIRENEPHLLVGDCAQGKGKELGNKIGGCPPDQETLLNSLVQTITD